jgi:hypothetical protein
LVPIARLNAAAVRSGQDREAFARGLADENGPVLGDADSRWGQQRAERVRDQLGATLAPHCDEAVSSAEVDADDHLSLRLSGSVPDSIEYR